MSTRELIEKEVAALPQPLQREVYDFATFLRKKVEEETFNGAAYNASPVLVKLERPMRSGFLVQYDNGQTAEVSWAFIRELPPKKVNVKLDD